MNEYYDKHTFAAKLSCFRFVVVVVVAVVVVAVVVVVVVGVVHVQGVAGFGVRKHTRNTVQLRLHAGPRRGEYGDADVRVGGAGSL